MIAAVREGALTIVPWLIAAGAMLLALSIAPGAPTCSNDGSHIALARSLSEGRVSLGPYAVMAGVDHAVREGVIYSDRAPGVALLLLPLVWLGLDPRLLSTAAFGGTLALLWVWLRRDGCTALAAGITVGIAATTLLLRYAPVLFAHVIVAFLLTAAGLLATGRTRHAWLLGLVLGWAAISEYAIALLAILGVFAVWRRWPAYVVAMAVPVGLAALYQWTAFGAPWRTGYEFQGHFPEARSFGTHLNGPLWQGLHTFVIAGKDSWGQPNNGLLTISPVLVLWPAGLFAYGLRWPRTAAALALICVAYLVLYSKHVAFAGGTFDSRYYVAFLPLVLMPIGHLLNAAPAWSYLAIAPLVLAGIENQVAHISRSYGWSGSLGWHWPFGG